MSTPDPYTQVVRRRTYFRTGVTDPMDAGEKRTTNRCTKLHELPSVATDWQQTMWCPDCEYYDRGTCSNPAHTGDNIVCPFDGKALPLREVAVVFSNNQSQKLLEDRAGTKLETHSRCAALEQTIQRRIVQRTGKRIQGLEVKVSEDRVVVYGSVPRYYLKQLALQGVFDELRSGTALGIELQIEVIDATVPGSRGE